MKKAFSKGQPVTFISSWDNKGTFYYVHAVVYSCGQKQCVLTNAVTGQEMGRHFTPAVGVPVDGPMRFRGTVARLSDAEAEALCLELAAAYIAFETADYTRRAENASYYGEGYLKGMKARIAELHEPRAIKR